MDLMKSLFACDSVAVPLVVANASDTGGYIPSGLQYATNLCLTKTPGELNLIVNISKLASSFGYPLTTDLEIEMIGEEATTVDEDGNPIVDWSFEADVGINVDDVVVKHVSAALSTSLISLAPSQKALACGGERTFILLLRSHGTSRDILRLDVMKSILGRDYDDSITLSEVAMSAKAGLFLLPEVRIIPRSEPLCPPSLWVEGGNLSFRASSSGIPPGLTEEYLWAVTGAQANGPLNGPNLSIALPSPPKPVEVLVGMTIQGVTVVDKLAFAPWELAPAKQLSQLLSLLCKIRSEVIRNRFFDPLWDPIKLGITDVKQRARLRSAAGRLATLSNDLAVAIEHLGRDEGSRQ